MRIKPKVKFYGTRGSIPICGPKFLEYGGNTTCLRVDIPDSNRIIIIDAGTGIRDLGKDLVDSGLDGKSIDTMLP